MITTFLNNTDQLPLTCSRKGTCCHGNTVFLNPWEIAQLANEKKITTEKFIEEFTEDGGIRLKFKGKQDDRSKSACNLYIDNEHSFIVEIIKMILHFIQENILKYDLR